MKTHISSEVFDQYLKIRISGENIYDEISEILTTIKRLYDENKRTKILIDGVDTPNLRTMERFSIGEMGLDVFDRNIKIAIFSKPENVNKFLETVVVNRGGNLLVTGNEQEARDWLLK